MKLKQKMALMLSGVMFAGLVAVVNPVEVKATLNTEEAPLTVPPNMSGFSSQSNGTPEETNNFTANSVESNQSTPKDGEYVLTGSSASGKKLTSIDLLATTDKSTFTYNGREYTAYNGFIGKTSGANWYDAQAFVKQLNDNSVDGCTSWTLLSNADMAFEWWQSTAVAGQQHPTTGVKYGQTSFARVGSLWSSAVSGSRGCYWSCIYARNRAQIGREADYVKSNGTWRWHDKSGSNNDSGFVVLRS